MLEEIEAAADWWSGQLRRSILNSSVRVDEKQLELVANFKNVLKSLLAHKFENHWHVDNPVRGSAYRSLAYDHCMDPTLLKAAEICGIQLRKIESLLSHTRSVIIFVNPGEVKMMTIIGGSHKSHPEHIWLKGKSITHAPEPDYLQEEKVIEQDSDTDDEKGRNQKGPSYFSPKPVNLKSNQSTPSKARIGYPNNFSHDSNTNFYPPGQYTYAPPSHRFSNF